MIRFALQRREPLRVQWERFLDAVYSRTGPPVGIRDGIAALSTARSIQVAGTSTRRSSRTTERCPRCDPRPGDRRPARPQRARDGRRWLHRQQPRRGAHAGGRGAYRGGRRPALGRRENLAGALRTRGLSLVEGDCAVLDQLLEIAREPFDLCFNLAVIPLPHSLEHPRRNVDHNVAMTTAVCELWRAGRLGRLIHYSSSEVYGTAQTAPIAETHPLHPHTPYAAAKAATDLVAHSYSTTFGMPLVIVRPFNTYGERQNSGSYAGLIPAVVGRVLAGLPVQIYGDGLQTRDMIYVRDSVAGTLAAATSRTRSERRSTSVAGKSPR